MEYPLSLCEPLNSPHAIPRTLNHSQNSSLALPMLALMQIDRTRSRGMGLPSTMQGRIRLTVDLLSFGPIRRTEGCIRYVFGRGRPDELDVLAVALGPGKGGVPVLQTPEKFGPFQLPVESDCHSSFTWDSGVETQNDDLVSVAKPGAPAGYFFSVA